MINNKKTFGYKDTKTILKALSDIREAVVLMDETNKLMTEIIKQANELATEMIEKIK